MSLKTKVLTAAAFAALLASTAVQAVTYTVGTGATYRPFEYEAPNKEIVGFDIDLMKAVYFSEPYFLAHQLILTSSNLQIKSLKDLEGKLIAVVNASAGDVAASNAFGKASTNIRRFDNTPLALEELANGGVDAMIGDVGVLQWYMKQNPDKKFNQCRDPEFQEQYFGIGVRKGNTQVLNDVNAGLKKVIESGAYNEVYRKWFGSDAPKLPAFTK